MRVVTVGGRSWVAGLEAAERPLDWRSQAEAHSSFIAFTQTDERVGTLATELAADLGLGYSSQDWVETLEGELVLLDVNPGGQWLFLPSPIAEEVALAIAAWLRGAPDELRFRAGAKRAGRRMASRQFLRTLSQRSQTTHESG